MIRNRRTVTGNALRVGFAALLAGVVGAVGTATPAAAHVTVNPREANQGGYARVAFRMPTESNTLSTTKLEVYLPEEHPIASVRTMPVPGWTVEVQTRTLDEPVESHGAQLTEVVSVITWTAGPEAALRPGEFGEFPVSLGPLPEADRLVFKALQTYSDGSVVHWIEEPVDGQPEPEHPAPVLTLAAGGDGHGGGGGHGDAGDGEDAADDGHAEGGSGTALGFGVAGLLAGLAGLVLGGLAFLRTRRGPGGSAA